MKKIHLLIFLISIFCLSTFSVDGQTNPNRLTEFPTPPHEFEIEVFFPGEKPTKPNIKVQILEAHDRTDATYGALMQRLQAQAQKAGVDAIVIMERHREEGFDPEYGVFLKKNYLSAIGIKYLENIDYLNRYKKSETIYEYDETKGIYRNVCSLKFKFDATIDSVKGKKTLREYLEKNSTWHLAFEKNKSWKSYLNSKNQIIRIYKNGQTKVYRIIKDNKMVQLNVKRKGEKEWGTIDITYDEKGKEKERLLTFTERTERERYFYNSDNLLWKVEVSKKEKGKEEIPYFKIEYDFHKNEDRDKLIEKYKFR